MSTSSATGPTSPAATPAPRSPSSPQLPRLSSFDPVLAPDSSKYDSPSIPLGTLSEPSFLDKILDCFAGIRKFFSRSPSSETLRNLSSVADQENESSRGFSSRDVAKLSAAEDSGFPSATPILISNKDDSILIGKVKVAASSSKSSGPSLLSRIASAFSRCFSGFFKEVQKDPVRIPQPEEPAFVPSQLKELREADSKSKEPAGDNPSGVKQKLKEAAEEKKQTELKRKQMNDYFQFRLEGSCVKIAEAFKEFEKIAPGEGSSEAFGKFLNLLKAESKTLIKLLSFAERTEDFCEAISKVELALIQNINSKGKTLSANARSALRHYLGDHGYPASVIDSLVSKSSSKKTGLETNKGMIAVDLLRYELSKQDESIQKALPRLMQSSFSALFMSGEVEERLASFVQKMSDLDHKKHLDENVRLDLHSCPIFEESTIAKRDGFKAALKELLIAYLKHYENDFSNINDDMIKALQYAEKLRILNNTECGQFYQEITDDAEVQSAILRFFLEKQQAGELSDVSGAIRSIKHMIQDESAISNAVRKAQEERVANDEAKVKAAAEKEKEIKAAKQKQFLEGLQAKEQVVLNEFEGRLTEIRTRAAQFELQFEHPIGGLFRELKETNDELTHLREQTFEYDHIDPTQKTTQKRRGTIQAAFSHYSEIRSNLLGADGTAIDRDLIALVTRCEADFVKAFAAVIQKSQELTDKLGKKGAEYQELRQKALTYIGQLKRDAGALQFDLERAATSKRVQRPQNVRALNGFLRELISSEGNHEACGVNKAIERAERAGVVRGGALRMDEPHHLTIPDSDPVMVEMSLKNERVRSGSTYERKEPLSQANGRSSPPIAYAAQDGRDAHLESSSGDADNLP